MVNFEEGQEKKIGQEGGLESEKIKSIDEKAGKVAEELNSVDWSSLSETEKDSVIGKLGMILGGLFIAAGGGTVIGEYLADSIKHGGIGLINADTIGIAGLAIGAGIGALIGGYQLFVKARKAEKVLNETKTEGNN